MLAPSFIIIIAARREGEERDGHGTSSCRRCDEREGEGETWSHCHLLLIAVGEDAEMALSHCRHEADEGDPMIGLQDTFTVVLPGHCLY